MTNSTTTTASFDKKFSETTLGYLSDIASAVRTTRAVSGPLAKSLYDDGFVVTDLYPHKGPNKEKSTCTKVWFDEYLFPTIASFAGFEAALWTMPDIKDGKHGDDVITAKRNREDARDDVYSVLAKARTAMLALEDSDGANTSRSAEVRIADEVSKLINLVSTEGLVLKNFKLDDTFDVLGGLNFSQTLRAIRAVAEGKLEKFERELDQS